MDLYTKVAYKNARQLTNIYSTSFSLSSTLFAKEIRHHIYAIYSLARIADEIVDTYRGTNAEGKLQALEAETYEAIADGYSTNPIVHAYATTAIFCDMPPEIISSFFKSMRMDLHPENYNDKLYKTYIYGSAEVIGLMCLRVFTKGDEAQYQKLAPGAQKLGSAYQKVNFLRDMSADFNELGRLYFPGTSYKNFNASDKKRIIKEIKQEFNDAETAIQLLPKNGKSGVYASFRLYSELLSELDAAPVKTIKNSRIRVGNIRKFVLLAPVFIKAKLGIL